IDVVTVPDRLDDRVSEAEHEQVLHRVLAEEMIDAINLILVVVAMQLGVQRSRALEIVAEGFLDDDAMTSREAVEPRLVESTHDARKLRRRHREIDGDVLARGAVRQPLDESLVKRRVAVISGHEIEAPREALENAAIDRALSRDQLLELRAEVVGRPVAARERNQTQAVLQKSAAV